MRNFIIKLIITITSHPQKNCRRPRYLTHCQIIFQLSDLEGIKIKVQNVILKLHLCILFITDRQLGIVLISAHSK